MFRFQQVKSPPRSFIFADDFASPAKLVDYLTSVAKNTTLYNSYHAWKSTYEKQYRKVGSRMRIRTASNWASAHVLQTLIPLCEACLALHNKTLVGSGRVAKRLDRFWNQSGNCRDDAFRTESGPSIRLWNWLMYTFNIYWKRSQLLHI